MVIFLLWLRDQDSNLGPRGYEPRELPLLHPASSLELYYNSKDIRPCQSSNPWRCKKKSIHA